MFLSEGSLRSELVKSSQLFVLMMVKFTGDNFRGPIRIRDYS